MPFSLYKQNYSGDSNVSGSDNDTAEGFFKELAVPVQGESISFSLDEGEAGMLVDVSDNKVLFEQNIDEKLYPASLTKILTALVVLKYCDLNETVTVTNDINNIADPEAVLMGLAPGDKLSVEALLKYMLINSYNDAAIALACHVSGSEAEFATLCNEEAYKLGATHTNFVNASGLPDENHYTCVEDLYIIFNECIKNADFRAIINQSSYEDTYQDINGETVNGYAKTTNCYFLSKYDTPNGITIMGGKTGTTDVAGFCLILLSQDSQGKEYISVILNAGSRDQLYSQMTDLLNGATK